MASASSDLKPKQELLVITSDPPCPGKAVSYYTKTHQYLLSFHQNNRRCSHTEAFKCAPHDHECLHFDASTCVPDGHGCSSSFQTECNQSECFSKCHNDASHDVFSTTESLYDDAGRDVLLEGHDKYSSNCFADGIRSLSITDTTSHDEAGCSQFNENVRKFSINGDVQYGLIIKSMDDLNGCHEMAVHTGIVGDVDKEMQRDLQNGHGNFFNIRTESGAEKVMPFGTGDSQHAPVVEIQKPAKRPFCKRCEKAQDLCICNRFKGVVQNKIKITILQNPKEKHHAVGSARVALLGLENASLIDVPEIYSRESFRIRPKVPGSKRSLAGRGGKKMLLKGGKSPVIASDTVPSQADILQMQNLVMEIFDSQYSHVNAALCPNENGKMVGGVTPQGKLHDSMRSEGSIEAKDGIMHKSRPPEEVSGLLNGNVSCSGHPNEENNALDGGSLCLEELESLIPPGVALLYPSDKAIELSQPLGKRNEQEVKAPCHLILLDGTWSKARRIYFENPWLQSLPHYKLSLSSPSLYEGVRRQPKPECLSTLESIVYALKVLEPDTEGLDGLLEVFDSMVEDQRRCKQMKCSVPECGTE